MIDPNIPLQAGRGIPQLDIGGSMLQGQQIAANRDIAQQRQMTMRQLQQAEQEQQALKGAYAFDEAGNVNPQETLRNLAQINPEMAMKFGQQMQANQLATGKAQSEQRKSALDFSAAEFKQKRDWNDRIAQLSQGVTDQATYARAISQAKQEGIPGIENLPPVYDPKLVEQLQRQSLSAVQAFDQWQKENSPTTEIGKLFKERQRGLIDEPTFQAMKSKLTTHAPAASMNFGTPQEGVSSETGKPVTYVVDKTGKVKILETVAPKAAPSAVAAQGKGKVDYDAVLGILSDAEKLLEKAPGSLVGAGTMYGARALGLSTESSQSQAKLNALQAALMMRMPRMEGPQSDKDVALYREQAGRIADPTLPTGDKLAALSVIKGITQRYKEKATAEPTKKASLPYSGKSASQEDLETTARETGKSLDDVKRQWISGGGKVVR